MYRKLLHTLLPVLLAVLVCTTASAAGAEAFLPGDVSRNGKVTAFDALLVQSHLHGEITLDDEQIEIAIRTDPEIPTLSTVHVMATLLTPMTPGKQDRVLPSADGRYHISEPSQLEWLRTFPNASFVLEQDIDMAGADWTPFAFGGTLDGNGCCIRDLHTIASIGKDLGVLFTSVGEKALVKNLALADCTLEPNDRTETVGIVCGRNDGTVVNCGASNILCGGQPLDTDDTETTGLLLSDGDAVRGVTYQNPVTVLCESGAASFRGCTFRQGLTVLRPQDGSFRLTLTDCDTNGAVTTAEADPANDPAANGSVTLFVPDGTAVAAQAHTFVQAASGSVFSLNGLTLTGAPGANADGSFEAEYRVGRKADQSLSASIRLHTTGSAAFTRVAGTLTDDLIVSGNADLSQVTAGEYAIGLTCGDHESIRCTIGNAYVQILTPGTYYLSGEDCGKLLFGEGALIYWNGSEEPLPLFVTWTEFSNAMDQEAKRVYISAFPTSNDFEDWRTAAQEMSKVHPKILDGTELDLGK